MISCKTIPFTAMLIKQSLYSYVITGLVTRLTWWVPLVEQELLILPEHLNSPPVISGVRVTRSLVFYVVFCRSLFVLLYFFFWSLCCLFFFDIRILIASLWYLQTLLKIKDNNVLLHVKLWRKKFLNPNYFPSSENELNPGVGVILVQR